MAPEEFSAADEIVRRQISDAIGTLQGSRNLSGTCAVHPGQVDATILNLRIGEQVLHRTGVIMQRLDELTAVAAASSAGNITTGKLGVGVGGATTVILAVLATIWKAKGWM